MRPGEVVGKQVKYFRGKRGWTQEDLVRRFEELGIPGWRQSKIAKVERGEAKRLPVDDVLELALALGCPPVMLLAPDPGSGLGDYDAAKDKVEVAPGHVMLARHAREWIRGRRAFVSEDADDAAVIKAATFYLEAQPSSDWIIDADAMQLSRLVEEMEAARRAVVAEQIARFKADGRLPLSEPATWGDEEGDLSEATREGP
jgi:transcriptional regulator with XRE-family HTH domain